MLALLQAALDSENGCGAISASSDLPLIGPESPLTSLGLVSFIVDVESALMDRLGLSVILVSESALSRHKSPFRTVSTLADYVLELAGAPSEPAPAN
jgi:hypothetical protein